ncbi:hypothetical protein MBLNU459_g3608t1 [Dothideomycetes sp. NU459]
MTRPTSTVPSRRPSPPLDPRLLSAPPTARASDAAAGADIGWYTRYLTPARDLDMDTDTGDASHPAEPSSPAAAPFPGVARQQRLIRDLNRFRSLAQDSPPHAPHAPDDHAGQMPADDPGRRALIQRALNRYHRIYDSARSYGDRIPHPAQQSLYDWAPTHRPADDDQQELDHIIDELRRQHPSANSDMLDFLGRRQLLRQRELEDEARSSWTSQQMRIEAQQRRMESAALERRNDSLRNAATLSQMRARGRSPSGTERMLRYLRTRERLGQHIQDEPTPGGREGANEAATAPSPIPAATTSTASTTTTSTQSPSAVATSTTANTTSAPSAAAAATSQLRYGAYASAFEFAQGSRYESNRLAWQSRQPLSQNARNTDTIADSTRRRPTDTGSRLDAFRRGYLANAPSTERPSPTVPLSPSLENAVKYLDTLRACSRFEDSLYTAFEHGLINAVFSDDDNDLVRDTHQCPPPAPSSWLQPGAVFQGSQNTASTRDSIHPSLRSWAPTTYNNYDPSRPFDPTRPWLSHIPASAVPPQGPRDGSIGHVKDMQDRWPVKVTIQAVDHDKMTMAGTMEAFDVPNAHCTVTSILASSASSRSNAATIPTADNERRPAMPKRNPPITTYLEGQIIDFSTHTFLTPSGSHSPALQANASGSASRPSRLPVQAQDIVFPPTSAITDAENWRKLPPFNAMKSDDEVARTLLSSSRMREIMSEWIFMRWKERCFIHSKTDPCHRGGGGGAPSVGVMPLGEGDDTDTGHGLTISGFYYVSLRRSDGKIEGLYFDTKTSPYQHLRLEAKRGGLQGAWAFK